MESFYAHDKTGLVVEYKLVGGSMVKTSQTTTNNDISWRAVQKFSTGVGNIRRLLFCYSQWYISIPLVYWNLQGFHVS